MCIAIIKNSEGIYKVDKIECVYNEIIFTCGGNIKKEAYLSTGARKIAFENIWGSILRGDKCIDLDLINKDGSVKFGFVRKS